MQYPKDQIEELKRYCAKLKCVEEGGITLFYLEGLSLPDGCKPGVCDALLCPVERDGYPSRLYLSVQVTCQYTRNWNAHNARIAEKNWFAFSWRVEGTNLTLAQILMQHVMGFTREK